MIFDGLHTSLIFYDDIDKQNRYRDVCEAVCDYRQPCPTDFLLPFQVLAEEDETTSVSYLYLKCEDGDTYTDLGIVIGSMDIHTIEGVGTYISSGPRDIKNLLPCGNFYLELAVENESGIHTYYSEVFTAISELANPTFIQQVFQPYSAWPWYDNQGKITENSAPCDAVCGYYSRSGNDALLPFQFSVFTADNITSWTLIGEDCIFTLDPSVIIVQPFGGKFNIIYTGDGIELPCGVFYGQMEIDGNIYYSEPIYISNDFETNTTNYILQEDGDRLLQEDSFGLLHEP